MRRLIRLHFLLISIASLSARLEAQDLAGQWQGMLHPGPGDLRIVLQISKTATGRWVGAMYSIDDDPDAWVFSSVTVDGSSFRYSVDSVRGAYEGQISKDGASIVGLWTLGREQPLPLEFRRAGKETAWTIPKQHKVQFIGVENDVQLEVLDWGGSGRSLVFLAGLGGTAHVFDRFAPKLTGSYHVYGITRRGFGNSSKPAIGYSADRLGDDVLAVIDALKLDKPVLVGHSIAGEELSSVGSRHPEKVAGLIYLDAGYSYAYYDREHGGLDTDLAEFKRKLDQFQGNSTYDRKAVQDILQTLPAFERALRGRLAEIDTMPTSMLPSQTSSPVPAPLLNVLAGEEKYTEIPVPILAIYAIPHNLGSMPGVDAAKLAAFEALDEITTGTQAKAFEDGVPTARVVRLKHASHAVYVSNEADVLRDMNLFLTRLH
jgi:pimeloyl-ACP methyl ester carboxylesterase